MNTWHERRGWHSDDARIRRLLRFHILHRPSGGEAVWVDPVTHKEYTQSECLALLEKRKANQAEPVEETEPCT